MSVADWIAVDWGTTSLRAWAMEGRSVLDSATSDQGMGKLAPEEFEPALLDLISGWLGTGPTPVIACGMVGARQGWVEAPYTKVPARPVGGAMARAPASDPRLDVRVIAGMCQAAPADVMRGEETQIAGFLALNEGWDGVICLPGTHTKWAHISAGEVVSFQTFMSGEMFSLLSAGSVLKHSTAGDDMDADAFREALSDTISRPERIASYLFNIRARDLLSDQTPAQARARLSGLLIGAELAAARPFWLGQNVAIIGADALGDLYEAALKPQGVLPMRTDATRMTLAGLTAAYRQHKETA